MTPEQIFFKQTTYSKAAKQFLPEPSYSYPRYLLQTWGQSFQHLMRQVFLRPFLSYPKLLLRKLFPTFYRWLKKVF